MGISVILAVVFCILQMSICQQAYQQKALNLHNRYRAKHKSPALTLDNRLNDVAVRCAKYYAKRKKISDHSCPFKKGVGENLFGGNGNWGDTQTAEMSTNYWYNEVKVYDYNKPGFSSATGHFTQVVWKNSQKLGFGYASINGFTVGVGIYSPPGNYQGDFPKNVLKP